ncbi:Magnesium and cobalt efflux protein CorC [Pseudovibrio sp. W64]|uniref:HlyC/CorC family transporter n=1 Tax=unclassified Pseudovibrio TaxID=2627060 RepID=UPI00070B10B8|nr:MULTISPECIES: HlyC/CorC family transporter [unclassified Pseudovibrio]KZK77421.1 Magnesium and cobalt efflux protein CorC [Pseudovibrio sp. W64]KZK88124.1 Magnesium and cobalt efflux protein CorC [Pseudovibrio sp. Ad13]KZK96220.1 Magnesium and cobalt efflux protein CorC [Pseudovibrio sp. Ad46]KZK99790.1 Magnesium and cobalt efflux protein CorC [Pseudovibrio sp. W74]KZL00968.1 Magnesium and cobalt efflux protein CorC [Pseudovibrio sp. Ad5]
MTDYAFWASVVAIVILLVLSGFFSGSETALTAASRARMHALVKSGNKRALIVARLIEFRERLIGALLLGNNLVNILASALATSLFLKLFGDAGVAYATLVMTLLVLIFSEVLPKTWAIANAEKFALSVAPVVRVLVIVFGPIVAAIEVIVRLVLRIFGIRIDDSTAVLSAHEELRGTLDLQHKEGGLIKADKDRIGGLLDLVELEVSDVMVHRTKLFALNADLPPEELVEEVLASPFTRIPLWRDDPDNMVGLLHAKDVLRAIANLKGDMEKFELDKVMSPLWFVPDTTSLQNQLNAFLKRKTHFALVVDEYGEVMGLVTLEDILEEIVGEIADEHDIELPGLKPQADGSVIVEGSVPIRDLNRATDWNLPDDEATTIAGLVIHEAKMIPEERQIFTFHGFRFTVLSREKNRITRLRMMALSPLQDAKKASK